jgi:hypothetical protein
MRLSLFLTVPPHQESWNWTDNSDLEHFPKMKNPDPTAPAPAEGEVPFKQKPLEWFQEAYPFQDGRSASARKAHEDEFILLQRRINEIAKNGVCIQFWPLEDLIALTIPCNRCSLIPKFTNKRI